MKPRFTHLLLLLYLALFVVRHLEIFYGWASFPHFEEIASAFEKMDQGTLFFPGPDLWTTGLRSGGPIYYWLHYPARLISNPVLAMHLYYAALELAGILLFLLLGPRGGLSRDLTWAAGLFLICLLNSKIVIAENITIAGHLALILFSVQLWAMGSAARLPMVLVGVLFGVLLQIHLTALFITPALLVALFLVRDRLPSRALAGLAGFALAVAMGVPGVEQPADSDMASTGQVLLHHFSPMNFASRLQSALESPLCLLGLVLCAAALIRPPRINAFPGGPAVKFALAWWITVFLLLCYGLSFMGGYFKLEHRLLLLNPARALLAGVALVALVQLCNRFLRRFSSRFLQVQAVLAAAAILLLAISAFSLNRNLRQHRADLTAEQSGASGTCDSWLRRNESRMMHHYAAALGQMAGGAPGQGNLRIHGAPKEEYGAALYWIRTSGFPPGGSGSKSGAKRHLLASPRLEKFDLGALPGARRFGSLLLVPGCTPVQASQLDERPREYKLDMEDVRPGRLAVAVIRADSGEAFDIPREIFLTDGRKKWQPLARKDCRDPNQNSFCAWVLFRLPHAHELRLVVPQRHGRLNMVELLLLPVPPGRS